MCQHERVSTRLKVYVVYFDQKTVKMPSPNTQHLCDLVSHFSRVNGIIHDRDPALKGRHLKESNVGIANVVKSDARVDPHGVVFGETCDYVRHNLCTDLFTRDCVAALNFVNEFKTFFCLKTFRIEIVFFFYWTQGLMKKRLN